MSKSKPSRREGLSVLMYSDRRLQQKLYAGKKGLVWTLDKAFEKSHRTGRPVKVIAEVNASPPKVRTWVAQDVSSDPTDLKDALKAARDRGEKRVAEILNGEEMLSAEQFADYLGTSRVTVNNRRQQHKVLALEGAARGFRFPKWQVGPNGKPFSALPQLFKRLGGDAWAVYRFLLQHHPELNGLTGSEALRRGKNKEAIEAAESITRYSA